MSDPSNLKGKLPLQTFFAVFLAIVCTGVFIVPWILNAAGASYLELQTDVNARQARSIGHFIEYRLESGASANQVTAEVQALLTNSHFDRGYSCVVSGNTTEFICHPTTQAVGMSVAGKKALFEELGGNHEPEKWEVVVTRAPTTAGLLHFPGGKEEIVYMYSVPDVGWTVTTHENTARLKEELRSFRIVMIVGFFVLGLLVAVPASGAARWVSQAYETSLEEKNSIIEKEKDRSEKLLLNILPARIAEELKSGRATIAERVENVSIMFSDIVGFTPLSKTISAEELVKVLNLIFSRFDDLADDLGLEKIKTIGDAYMVCGGLIDSDPVSHVHIGKMALGMIRAVESVNRKRGLSLQIRIGINSGDVVAGVIGKRKFIYDLWGDAVNVASRMESSGVPGRIQVSPSTWALLKDHFSFEARELIEVKGIGSMQTYLLVPTPR